jgi:hypothetical protein
MTTRKKKTSKAKKKDLPLRVFAIKPPTKRKKSGKAQKMNFPYKNNGYKTTTSIR